MVSIEAAGVEESPVADVLSERHEAEGSPDAQVMRKVAFGALANAVEWYDFCMFGLLAPQIGRAFFPHAASPALELIRAFGVFAAAFVARPIGGAVFGGIGDRFGRKRALYVSVMMMALSTSAIGILPRYSVAGWVAPLLLLVCRIFQGLSVGGQFIGTILLTTEGMPENRRPLYFSVTLCSGQLSMAIAALVVAILHRCMAEDVLNSWGWRIPFLTGIVAVVGAHSVQSGIAESSSFESSQKSPNESSAEEVPKCLPVLWLHRWPLVQILTITAGGAITFYNASVWLPSYLTRMHQPPLTDAYLIVTAVTICTCLITPLMACVAGRWPMLFLVAGLASTALFTLPVFAAAEEGGARAITVTLVALLLSNNAWFVTVGSWMPFLVETRARYTVTAVGYNASMCLFGGFVPMLSTVLARHFDTAFAPGALQLAVLLVSLSFASCLAHSFTPESGAGSATSLYELVPSTVASPGRA